MAAEARRAKLLAGATPEEIAAAEAAVEIARAGESSVRAALASAEANLAALRAGATPEEIAIAERQVEAAKDALWGAQSQRDAVCGRTQRGGRQADCDAANAGAYRGEEEVRIAQLRLQQLHNGPRAEEIAMAEAQVLQAQGQLSTAQAQTKQAEARLAQVRAGASTEDLAGAEAEVRRATAQLAMVRSGSRPETIAAVKAAEAALAQARVYLEETALRAPFVGTVGEVAVEVGEQVAPGTPIARLGDLTELAVVNIAVGNGATVAFDAIGDLELAGKVARIKPLGQSQHGDIVYTVVIALTQGDPRLHWNMTASVEIERTE